jgi:hypothetical protein
MNSFRLNRRGVLIATTASIPALLLCSRTIAGTNPTTQAAVGKAAPAFEVIDVAKNKRSLSEFKGKTVVLEWTSPS